MGWDTDIRRMRLVPKFLQAAVKYILVKYLLRYLHTSLTQYTLIVPPTLSSLSIFRNHVKMYYYYYGKQFHSNYQPKSSEFSQLFHGSNYFVKNSLIFMVNLTCCSSNWPRPKLDAKLW